MRIVKRQILDNLLAGLVVMMVLVDISQGATINQYFQITPQTSSVAYEPMLHVIGVPEDTDSRPIRGGFRMIVDDAWGFPNLRFEDVHITTPQLSYGNFDFPDYLSRYNGPDFSGTDNICTWFGSGFCMTSGNIASFSGTFDGTNLMMSGNDPIDFFSSYLYTIHASAAPDPSIAVPEPATAGLLGAGLAFFGWIARRRKAL